MARFLTMARFFTGKDLQYRTVTVLFCEIADFTAPPRAQSQGTQVSCVVERAAAVVARGSDPTPSALGALGG